MKREPLSRDQLKKFIETKFKVKDPRTANKIIYENKVGLFTHGELKEDTDFYFCPVVKKLGKYYLKDDLITIFKIPNKVFKNLENLEKSSIVTTSEKYDRTYFPKSLWELVYNEKNELEEDKSMYIDDMEDLEGDDKLFDKLTMRDYACIHLRNPQSSKSWLNKLIKPL